VGLTFSLAASGVPYQTGDVFAGTRGGTIAHFSSTGALLDTLTTGGSSYMTGMAFDTSGNLYATGFDAQNVSKFDDKGSLLGSFGSGYNHAPESIVFDKNGNAYVGQAGGSILKFSPTGGLIGSFSPQGTDWVDLASDQCTIYYTSEGNSVRRFNVCSNTQLADFATGLSGRCFANRIRPNSEVLVACTSLVYRLNSTGGVMQTYQPAGVSILFALNLDPDNKTFWTADQDTGTVFHIDIATGNILAQFSGSTSGVDGLTVVGEITAAVNAPPYTTSYYVRTTKSATLNAMGRALAQSQINLGIAQDSVVALLFRAPALKNGQYGVSGLGGFTPLSTVATLVEDFATGYYNSLGTNTTLHVRIVIATGNGITSRGGNRGNRLGQQRLGMVLCRTQQLQKRGQDIVLRFRRRSSNSG